MKVKGMTLLEVMVALAIFAITGTAVLKAASEHLRGLSQIEEITFAGWVANNRLTEVELEAKWPPQNNAKGQAEMADQTWYWQQTVTKTGDDDMRKVDVSVSLSENGDNSITSVSRYLVNPGAAK